MGIAKHYLIVLSFFYLTNARAEPFTINVIEAYQGHSEQSTLEGVYSALYAPLGITPKLVYYPSKRGLLLVNNGELDAEAARFELTSEHYTNLVKVDEILTVMQSGVYCLTREHCQLGQNVNLVALESFRSANTFCLSKNLSCSYESKPDAIAKLLAQNIAQGFLSSTLGAYKVLCAVKQDTIYYKNIADFARASFHYVHKRHADLVPKLEETIRTLKEKNVFPKANFKAKPQHASCGKTIVAV